MVVWVKGPLLEHNVMIRELMEGTLRLRVHIQPPEHLEEIFYTLHDGGICTISQALVRNARLSSSREDLQELEEDGLFFQRCIFGLMYFD